MSSSQSATFVGIDIGGTSSRLAIVDAFGRVAADRREPTPTGEDGEELVRWLDEAYHACRGETDSLAAPSAIGVGVPGVLEPGRSAVIRAVNLPFIEGLPLRDRLIERTGLPTILDCDTITAGWGEFCAREKKSARFAYLTIGTGVGACIIIDGKVLRHTHHSAGHLGHIVCDTSSKAPTCRCGLRGCLETLVAGPALLRAAEEQGLGSSLDAIESDRANGDQSAIRFVDAMAKPLAIALCNIIHVYATDTIVIGGGVTAGLPSLVHRVAEIVCDTNSTLFPPALRVEINALDQYSGVVGAALLAAEHLRTRSIT